MTAGEYCGEIGESGMYGKDPTAGETGFRGRPPELGGGGRGKF